MSNSTATRGLLGRSRWAAIGAAVAVTLGGSAVFVASAADSSATGSVTVTIVPCRFIDTRTSGSLAAGTTIELPAYGPHGACNIPTDATALLTNLTAVNQTSAGFLTVFPSDVARPLASSLNWTAGNGATANQVTAKLSPAGMFSVFNSAGSTDVVIDVVGYLTLAAAGTNGIDGTNGVDGEQGLPGEPGEQGEPGEPGDTNVQTIDVFVAGSVFGSGTTTTYGNFYDATFMALYAECIYSDEQPNSTNLGVFVQAGRDAAFYLNGLRNHLLADGDTRFSDAAMNDWWFEDVAAGELIDVNVLTRLVPGGCQITGTVTNHSAPLIP